VVSQVAKTGFVIQRLTEDPDRGDALVRGFFRTQKGFLLNQALLYKKANHHLQDLLTRVADTGRLPEPEPSLFPYSGLMLEFPRFINPWRLSRNWRIATVKTSSCIP